MKGRTALVTGASRGLGAAIAARLRAGGARVLAPSRGEMDLKSPASIASYLEGLGRPVHVLVNNAGINPAGAITEVGAAEFQEVLQVNLSAAAQITGILAGAMKARGYGRIVHIASIWGLVAYPRRAAYAASKAGLMGLTRCQALELAPYGILVNAVAPGFVDTEMTRRNSTAAQLRAIAASIPLSRLARPREIAEVVAFLCSAGNAYITGQVLVADGGYTCQ